MKKTVILLFVVLTACTTTKQIPVTPSNTMVVDGKIFTTVYQQRAAEYRALCYQAFNIAFLRLDQALAKPSVKPKAIVTDIDETVLDNSLYAAMRGINGQDYESASWFEYTSKGIADTIPGALNFLLYARSQGVEIFYITNREAKERAGTLQNLKRFRFPDADEAHLLTKENSSSKESRRLAVANTHEIVLLLGDNLSDFSLLFDKKPADERFAATNAVAALFGNRFIIIPNPVYGDWEAALYQFNYKLSGAAKDSVLKHWLKTN